MNASAREDHQLIIHGRGRANQFARRCSVAVASAATAQARPSRVTLNSEALSGLRGAEEVVAVAHLIIV